MSIIRRVWHSVGLRLLAGFWVTLIAAVACVWLVAKWSGDELAIERLNAQDERVLNAAKMRLTRAMRRSQTVADLFERMPRNRGVKVVLYDLESAQILSAPDRFKSRLDRDVSELIEQNTPLKLTRLPYQLMGPTELMLADKPYLLFIQRITPNTEKAVPRIIVLLVVLLALSIVFTLVFTRSLVIPIKVLRQSSQRLAAGDWSARVDEKACRQDELGELATAFNNMADKLADNWHSQQRLLADVSHELRSPLTRLNIAVALAEQAAKNDDVIQEALLRIESETAKMDELIGNVLQLSRTESAMAQKAQTDVQSLVLPVLNNAEFEANQMGKKLHIENVPNGIIFVQTNAVQSAIENVVRNAIYYAKQHVFCECTLIEHDGVSGLKVVISDDGPGLEAAQLKEIFSPFYRAQKSRDRQSGGVGLGLAIAKAATTAHHGGIVANNREGGGLQVTLTFLNP